MSQEFPDRFFFALRPSGNRPETPQERYQGAQGAPRGRSGCFWVLYFRNLRFYLGKTSIRGGLKVEIHRFTSLKPLFCRASGAHFWVFFTWPQGLIFDHF